MDYEKKYKEALGWMQSVYPTMTGSVKEDAEHYFPELRESEDEKVRKTLLESFEYQIKESHPDKEWLCGVKLKEVVAWLEKQKEPELSEDFGEYVAELSKQFPEVSFAKLSRIAVRVKNWFEKQGEQKPILDFKAKDWYVSKVDGKIHNIYHSVDKVEPKFKVGDWVASDYNNVAYIESISETKYNLRCKDGYHEKISIEYIDRCWHLWSIKDAKPGDVLCCESGWTCIFKTLNSDNISFSSYCFMDNTGWFCETGSESHTLEKAFIKAYNGNIYPATKEQRDLLFQKMHEASFVWDAEKKELKKIEQKSAWSEEDESMYTRTLGILGKCYMGNLPTKVEEELKWFKSLKQRIGV